MGRAIILCVGRQDSFYPKNKIELHDRHVYFGICADRIVQKFESIYLLFGPRYMKLAS